MNKGKKALYLSPTKFSKIHDFKQFKKMCIINLDFWQIAIIIPL